MNILLNYLLTHLSLSYKFTYMQDLKLILPFNILSYIITHNFNELLLIILRLKVKIVRQKFLEI